MGSEMGIGKVPATMCPWTGVGVANARTGRSTGTGATLSPGAGADRTVCSCRPGGVRSVSVASDPST
eukprot:14357397-Heterocapsa_arctica.AAC.1